MSSGTTEELELNNKSNDGANGGENGTLLENNGELSQTECAVKDDEDSDEDSDVPQNRNFGRFQSRYNFSYKTKEKKDAKGTLSPTAMVLDFCSRTSSQGIAHVYAAPGKAKRVLWLVIAMCCIIMLFTHLGHLTHDFLQFNVTTEVSVVPWTEAAFPAVTFCNIHDDNDKHKMILSASFEGKTLNISDEFKLFKSTTFSNCYSFNKNDSSPFTPKDSRPLLASDGQPGLQLILNIASYDYLAKLKNRSYNVQTTGEHGVVIKIHHPNEDPNLADGNTRVFTGTSNRISITQTQIFRKGGNYGNGCDPDADRKGYTRRQCEHERLECKVREECGCYISKLLSSQREPNCTKGSSIPKDIQKCPTNSDCMLKAKKEASEEPCKDFCNELIYEQAFQSSGSWLRKEEVIPFRDWILDQSGINSNSRLPEQFTGNDTEEIFNIIENNMVKVDIFYESMSTYTITESPQRTVVEFASELGGTFGLWVGWTVMTVFEFVEIAVDLIVLYSTKRKQRKSSGVREAHT